MYSDVNPLKQPRNILFVLLLFWNQTIYYSLIYCFFHTDIDVPHQDAQMKFPWASAWELNSSPAFPELHYHLFSLANVPEEVVIMIPVRQLLCFLQTCLFIVITDQLLHSCVNSKLDDKVGPKSWYTVYLCTGHTTSLTSYFLLAQGSVSSQVLEFCD